MTEYEHRVILMEPGTKAWFEPVHKETIKTADQAHPNIVIWEGKSYVYSHDELVGDVKLRAHYYKMATSISLEDAVDISAKKPKPTLKNVEDKVGVAEKANKDTTGISSSKPAKKTDE